MPTTLGSQANTAYRATVQLRNGRPAEIRALREEDAEGLLKATRRSSPESTYKRFFSAKRGFSAEEVRHFTRLDFDDHVALVALLDELGKLTIVAGARYIALNREKAEVAFWVIDEYQGLGLGSALLHHLGVVARNSGFKMLEADVLTENSAMLGVFRRSPWKTCFIQRSDIVRVIIALNE